MTLHFQIICLFNLMLLLNKLQLNLALLFGAVGLLTKIRQPKSKLEHLLNNRTRAVRRECLPSRMKVEEGQTAGVTSNYDGLLASAPEHS